MLFRKHRPKRVNTPRGRPPAHPHGLLTHRPRALLPRPAGFDAFDPARRVHDLARDRPSPFFYLEGKGLALKSGHEWPVTTGPSRRPV